jgi:hypothetical protein
MMVVTRAAMAAVTFSGVALVLGAGAASAEPPEGGCPKYGGWSLVPTALLPERHGDDHDQNNNGLVCLTRECDGPSDCRVMVKDDMSRDAWEDEDHADGG